MGSVWRIAAKICHNDSAFVSPFLSFSLAASQDREVLDIILAMGEDQETMATMVALVTTLVGVAITMVADQITMADQAITQADQTTMATMEDQDTTLEEGEVVLTTTGTTEDLGTTLVAMATTAVVDLITTAT